MTCDICGREAWGRVAERNGWCICAECIKDCIDQIAERRDSFGSGVMTGKSSMVLPRAEAAKR